MVVARRLGAGEYAPRMSEWLLHRRRQRGWGGIAFSLLWRSLGVLRGLGGGLRRQAVFLARSLVSTILCAGGRWTEARLGLKSPGASASLNRGVRRLGVETRVSAVAMIERWRDGEGDRPRAAPPPGGEPATGC